MIKFLLIVGYLTVSSARAEDEHMKMPQPASPAKSETQKGPCSRGDTQIKMAGVDIDQNRCANFLSSQELGSLMTENLQLKAQIILLQGDLEAVKENEAKEKQPGEKKDDKR